MRPLTERMQRALNVALVTRDGVVYTGVIQARGLIGRGLAVANDRHVVWTGAYVTVTAAGFALAEPGYSAELRDRAHREALAAPGCDCMPHAETVTEGA